MTTRYIHGSQDSTDLDVHYVFESLPSFGECQAFCSKDPDENRNMIVIKDGNVIDCYKGTPDEINNGLYLTYGLHKQDYPLLVKGLIARDALIKCVRAVRCVLSHYSRTSDRALVKKALRSGSWDEKLDALRKIDYANILDFKKDTRENVFKIFAFQIGQTLGLLEGVELFTKADIATHYPKLKTYLYRELDAEVAPLIAMIHQFVVRLSQIPHDEVGGVVVFPSFNKTIDLSKEKYV